MIISEDFKNIIFNESEKMALNELKEVIEIGGKYINSNCLPENMNIIRVWADDTSHCVGYISGSLVNILILLYNMSLLEFARHYATNYSQHSFKTFYDLKKIYCKFCEE